MNAALLPRWGRAKSLFAKMKIVRTKKNQSRIELNGAEWQFLRDNYRSMTDRELLNGLKAMGCKITFGKLRQLKYEQRLVKQRQVRWTAGQVQFLLDNYRSMGNVEMAAYFGWPKKKGVKRIWKKMIQMKLKRSKSQTDELRKNQPNLRKDGEVWFQECSGHKLIKSGGEITYYARWVWENKHGPIPDGFCVVHKNDDRRDCRIWNLELLSREEVAKKYLTAHAQTMSDEWIASTLTKKNPRMKEYLKEHPELIELQRQRIINNRKIKQIENEK